LIKRIVDENVLRENYKVLLNNKREERRKEIEDEVNAMRENNDDEDDINNKQKDMWQEFNDQIEENFKWEDYYKSEIENYEEI